MVTGTRAEYGLLRPLMKLIHSTDEFELQVLITGMHLSPEFGETWKEIAEDGFPVSAKVEMLLSADSATTVGQSTGIGIMGCTREFERLSPDIVVVLGDRFETFAAVTSCLFLNIPVAHIHGGELTEGAFDDSLRHSITKMSYLHFTATEVYRQRVIQLGESPDRVWNVGAPALDSIEEIPRLTQLELEASLGFNFREKNALITFHPETLGEESSIDQFCSLLAAFEAFPELGLIFTYPNADTEGRALIKELESFVSKNSGRVCAVDSLGQQRYFSVIELVDVVVGNSSSGLIEVPFFGKPTINIGNRQKGRIIGSTVFNCEAVKSDIESMLSRVLSENCHIDDDSPYGESGVSLRIFRCLCDRLRANRFSKKAFFDIE